MMDEKQENPQEEPTQEQKDAFFKEIQQSIFSTKGSRHMEARMMRRWFRTWSPKAKRRKKARRKAGYASRKYNRQRAKAK